MGAPEFLLRAEDLTKVFDTPAGPVEAVRHVNLAVRKGETMGLVGESGSGKSTVGRLLLRLINPTSGHLWFADQDLTKMRGAALRRLRRRMQIVFQNPQGSLLPHLTAADNVSEPLRVHGMRDRRRRREEAMRLLDLVGLSARQADLYPRQFSGGQQQRIAIARALALKPDLIVCDEPTSALDVSIQAQILNLLERLQAELGLTYFFISHNLAVVERLATRVAVMYRGELVEEGPAAVLFSDPRHPYTRALLAAVVSVRGQPVPSANQDLSWVQTGGAAMEEVTPGHMVRRVV